MLERVVIESMQDEGGSVEADALRDKRRVDRPRVKKIGVIADLAELHQDVDDTHEVPCCQRLLGGRLGHEVIVKVTLALGKTALDDMLVFLWHLLLYIHFYPSQEEGTQHLVQSFD